MSLKSIVSLSVITSILISSVTGCASKLVEHTPPRSTVENHEPMVVEYHTPKAIIREVRHIKVVNGITTKQQVYKILGQPSQITNSEDVTGEPEDYAIYEVDETGFDISLNYLDKDGITYTYSYKQDTSKSAFGVIFDKNNIVKGLLY